MNNTALLTSIKNRRSIRSYKDTQISDDDLNKIIEAASAAPSGSNTQNWHFIIIKSKEISKKLRDRVENRIKEMAGKMNSKTAKDNFLSYSKYYTFFTEAPVLIAVVMRPYDSLSMRILSKYDPESNYKSTAGIQGVSAAIENLLLASHALGYGACWMTGPLIAKEKLEEILKIKSEDELVALIPIGVPKTVPPMPKRKDINEIVTRIND